MNTDNSKSPILQKNVSSSNGLEPLLRFPEFKDRLSNVKLSSLFKKCTQKNKDNQVINVICNSAKNGLVPQRDFFDKDIANSENTSGYYIIQKQDFVYNPRKSNEAPYGPISMYKYEEDGIVSPLYLCFRSIEPLCADFFETYFKSPAWYRYVYLMGDSGARHDRVSIKDDVFFDMPINVPSLPEQEKIAEFLSLIDERIEKQRQLVDALKRYKRGVINGIFDNKLYGKSWNTYKLSKILKERNTYCEKNGTYEHVTLSRDGIFPKTERYDRDYLVSSDDKRYKVTKLGDICYNPANMKFGVICLNTYGNAIFSPIYVTFEIENGFDKNIVAFCLTRQNFINRTLKYQQGTVYERMSVSPSDLLNMEINLPDAESQIKISKQLLLVDSLSRKETDVLYKMELLKRGFLQQLFI